MKDKVRMGVIGLGIMGESYVRVYGSYHHSEVTAICDSNDDRLQQIGDKYGLNTRYTRVDDLVANPNVDAVCVATPDFVHYEPVKKALLAGKHVIVEKPLTISIDEADDLVRLQKATSLKLQVGYNHRWLSGYHAGFVSIDRGDIGKPLMAYARKNDTIYVATDYIKWAGSSTPCYFLNSHDIDLVRWFFHSEPVEARAWGVKEVLVKRGIDTYDAIQSQVRFSSGAIAMFESAWIYPNTFPAIVDSFVEVVGTRGHLHFDRKRESVEMSTPEAFTYPKNFLNCEVFGKSRGAFPACLEDFVEAILNNREPHVTVRDGRQVTATLAAIHESLRTGNTETVRPAPAGPKA